MENELKEMEDNSNVIVEKPYTNKLNSVFDEEIKQIQEKPNDKNIDESSFNSFNEKDIEQVEKKRNIILEMISNKKKYDDLIKNPHISPIYQKYLQKISLTTSLDVVEKKIRSENNFNIVDSKINDPKIKLNGFRDGTVKKIIKNDDSKPKIELLSSNRTDHDFAFDVAGYLYHSNDVFYNQTTNKIVEIKQFYREDIKKDIWLIKEITPIRFKNILENKFSFYIIEYSKNGENYKSKSPTEQQIKYLLDNDDIINSLYKINRFENVRLPYIVNENLIITEKGINEKLNLFVLNDSPDIEDMNLDKAKQIINNILNDFCFETENDKMMAISALITPACRGIYPSITTRTPIFLYNANRAGAGKDYLAGVVGIIYEGLSVENPAICSTDKFQNLNEELRKKITSSLINGTKRLHFSNNKGYLNSTTLENITTAETWSDRILGKNEQIQLPNTLEFSLSSNMGLTWTPDLDRRMRIINLFYAEENINKRVYAIPNLHEYVQKNRGLILSAIITFIKYWYSQGMPTGDIYNSFSEWGRVVGGVMKVCDLGNPCITIENDSMIGGDSETINFKKLFEFMSEVSETSPNPEFTLSDIRTLIQNNQEERDFFIGWKFDEKSTQTSFSIKFIKFVGRELSGIKLILSKDNDRKSRIKYSFKKTIQRLPPSNNDETKSELVTCGNLSTTMSIQKNNFVETAYRTLPRLPRLPPTEEDVIDFETEILALAKENIAIEELFSNFPKESRQTVEETIKNMLKKGEIFESKSGYIRVLQ